MLLNLEVKIRRSSMIWKWKFSKFAFYFNKFEAEQKWHRQNIIVDALFTIKIEILQTVRC